MIAPNMFVSDTRTHGDVSVPYQPLMMTPAVPKRLLNIIKASPVMDSTVNGFCDIKSMVDVSPRSIGMIIS